MNRKALLQALQMAKKVLDRHHTAESARHVLLYQDGQRSTLYAVSASEADQYDQEQDSSHRLMVRMDLGETSEHGTLWLDARKAIEALKTLDREELESIPDCVRIHRMREPDLGEIFYWSCLLTRLRTAEQAPAHEVPAGPLRQILDRTLHAVSTDETRMHLNGLWLETLQPAGHKLRCRAVATDGHRLTRFDLEWSGFPELARRCLEAPEKPTDRVGGVVINRAALELLDGLVGRKTATLAVHIEPERFAAMIRTETLGYRSNRTETKERIVRAPQHAIFRIGNVTVCARLLPSHFPPYEQVIPRDSQRDVTVDRKMLLQALKRVELCANERSKAVMLTLAGESQLRLETDNGESGDTLRHANETLPATCGGFIRDTDHAAFRIGLHIPYLRSALESTDGKTVRIQMNDGLDPIRIDSADVKDHLNVIMPCRP